MMSHTFIDFLATRPQTPGEGSLKDWFVGYLKWLQGRDIHALFAHQLKEELRQIANFHPQQTRFTEENWRPRPVAERGDIEWLLTPLMSLDAEKTPKQLLWELFGSFCASILCLGIAAGSFYLMGAALGGVLPFSAPTVAEAALITAGMFMGIIFTPVSLFSCLMFVLTLLSYPANRMKPYKQSNGVIELTDASTSQLSDDIARGLDAALGWPRAIPEIDTVTQCTAKWVTHGYNEYLKQHGLTGPVRSDYSDDYGDYDELIPIGSMIQVNIDAIASELSPPSLTKSAGRR